MLYYLDSLQTEDKEALISAKIWKKLCFEKMIVSYDQVKYN